MLPPELTQSLRNVLTQNIKDISKVTDCIYEAEHDGSGSNGQHKETGYKTVLRISGPIYIRHTPQHEDETHVEHGQPPRDHCGEKGLSLLCCHQLLISSSTRGGAL